MKSFSVLFLAALFILSGCSTSHPRLTQPEVYEESRSDRTVGGATGERIDASAESAKLIEADLAFSRLCEEKGAATAFYEFLTPDAISLPPGEFPIKGREAIRVHLSAGPQGVLTWKPAGAELSRSGDLGYTWGAYEFSIAGADGRPQPSYGKYVTIWKKQPDGSWKVALDTGNASPPPTQRR
jgi:ketosteroid isomerase-like protein